MTDVSPTDNVPQHSLFFCVDGSDLDDIASVIRGKLMQLVGERRWSRPTHVVDEKHPPDDSMGPDDLVDWELGVIHELPDAPGRDEWFAELAHIAVQVDQMAASTGREFVVALVDNHEGSAEDITYLDGRGVDLERLRAILGSPPTSDRRAN